VTTEPPAPRPAGFNWPGVLGLGVFALVLWAQTSALVGVFYDDGVYVTAAKALAEGHGYRNIHLPDAPPMVKYPILYPLLLSVLWRWWPVFPANVALFQLADAAALGAAAWIIGAHAGRIGVPPGIRYPVLALGFAAFPLLTLVGVRFAEPLLLLLVAGAVALADREPADPRAALAAGTLAGLAALAKTTGMCAVLGIPLSLWLRGRRRSAILAAAPAVALMVPWMAWVAAQAGNVDSRLTNYTPYGQVVEQTGLMPLLQGLVTLRAFWPVPQLLLPRLSAWGFVPLAVVVVALLVWGGVASFRRAPALVVTVAIYMLTITVWPYIPDRFVWIMMPWLGLFLAVGWGRLWRVGRTGRAAAVLVAAALAVGYLRREALSLGERRFARLAERISGPFRVLTASLGAEVPPGAVVASEGESLIYLYTGRRSVPSYLFRWRGTGTAARPHQEAIDYWCEAGVTHLVVTGPSDSASTIAAQLASRSDSAAAPLFQVTGGPALYRFRCPR